MTQMHHVCMYLSHLDVVGTTIYNDTATSTQIGCSGVRICRIMHIMLLETNILQQLLTVPILR